MQEKVAAAKGLIGIAATKPEETGTGDRAEGSRIEGVAAVYQGEGFVPGRETTVVGGRFVLK
ncbi:MAG: hypothetical protein CMP28_08660 [Roseibacillus sp.]|nr:hypothetical protein [Roseibacillus sp.]